MTRCLAAHVINLNFSKAFNIFAVIFLHPSWDITVWVGGSNQGIKLWLHDHDQMVVANELFSTSRLVASRIPQGSVLQSA